MRGFSLHYPTMAFLHLQPPLYSSSFSFLRPQLWKHVANQRNKRMKLRTITGKNIQIQIDELANREVASWDLGLWPWTSGWVLGFLVLDPSPSPCSIPLLSFPVSTYLRALSAASLSQKTEVTSPLLPPGECKDDLESEFTL